MKKHNYITLLSAIFVLGTAISVFATPPGTSNQPFDYLIKGKELNWLSMGIYGGQFNRDIKWDNGIVQKLTSNRIHGFVGVDPVKWLTIYVIGGSNDSSLNDSSSDDYKGEFGFGIHAKLLNHFIAEPVLTCDAIRFNANSQYLRCNSDIANDSSWNDISGSLTISLVNDTTGNKFFNPESIAIYAGPMLSLLIGDGFDEDTAIGFVGGLEIFVVDSVALSVEYQYFDESSIAGGLSYHF